MMDVKPIDRILGLDYGEKRIGLALSDPLCIFAQPWGFEPNTEKGIEAIVTLVAKEKVSSIVVGLPLNLKGKEGISSTRVRAFIDALGKRTTATIVTWDERFTTTMAQRSLRELESTRKGRNAKSGRVDAMAAAVLLQSFLDSTKHSRVC